MGWFTEQEYWLDRLVPKHSATAIYCIAFVAVAMQFQTLIGEHGMLTVPRCLAKRFLLKITESLSCPLLRWVVHPCLLVRRGETVGVYIGSYRNWGGRLGTAVGCHADDVDALESLPYRSSTSARCGMDSAGRAIAVSG